MSDSPKLRHCIVRFLSSTGLHLQVTTYTLVKESPYHVGLSVLGNYAPCLFVDPDAAQSVAHGFGKGAKVYYLDDNEICFKVWDAGTDTAIDVDWKLTDEPQDTALEVQDASTGSKSRTL